MQIAVTFRHMETDEGVKEYVREKVQRLQKYVENSQEVHVVLSVEKFRHIAEITIVGEGLTLNSQGRNNDLYAAIDQMAEKMERQIRERRGKVRRKRSASSSSKMPPEGKEDVSEGKEETEIPAMIRRRRTVAKPMSLDEAVAQLQVSQHDYLVFFNSDSGQMNVLCRGKDGGYEWVEPHPK
ncbi:MAG: ribosome-associated translation inhibitor RaiA [Thermodesulfobacteriota bacterium]|jgi:putative sigma-54 modulation protein